MPSDAPPIRSETTDGAPPRAPGWYLAPRHLVLVALWGAGFWWLNAAPLAAPDLWGHASYGRWILDFRMLPVEDPFVPLSGMPVYDGAWLSQVIFGWVAGWAGNEGLSCLFAVTVLAAYLILARAFFLQSRDVLLAHIGVLLVVAIGGSRTATARPELFGTVCFAVLLWLLVRDRTRTSAGGTGAPDAGRSHQTWTLWCGVPALMALWANLDPSFVWGLLVLTCWAGGTIAEAVWRQRRSGAPLADPAARRWLVLWQLAAGATCLNPYGPALVLHAIWFRSLERLRELAEWQPLVFSEPGGLCFVASLLLLLGAFRHSRRRVPVADVLLLVAFSLAVARGQRLLWWYAAVFGLVALPHVADVWTRLARSIRGAAPRAALRAGAWFGRTAPRSWKYSLAALGLVWITVAVSPAGSWMGSRQPRVPAALYADGTPWKLSAYLRERPPTGQVFNPDWWGDWLAWDGPPGLQLFLTANLDLLPQQVWTDYRIIRETRSGWTNVLERYGIEAIVVDNRRQTTLLRYLRGARDWRLLYEDEVGTVFGRAGRRVAPPVTDET